MLRDFRFALRSARRSLLVSATVVLTLALGLGVSTTAFSLVDAILLRPLPVAHPERLVNATLDDGFPILETEYFRDRSRSLSGIIAYDGTRLSTVVQRQPGVATAGLVSGDVFAILGVPVLGRPLRREDDRPGAVPVAVASCAYATRQFGSPTAAIGQTVMLDALSTSIIGVMPCDFPGLTAGEMPEDLWLPLVWHPQLGLNDHTTVGILARLAPGANAAVAQRELTDLHRTFTRDTLGRVLVSDGSQGLERLAHASATPLRVLAAAAAAVLLLVCANVMNLLLTRGAGRRQEIMIRLAMGASRPQIVRQLVVETLVYALAGGILAVFAAYWLGPVLATRLAPSQGPLMLDLVPRGRVLAFVAVAVLATVLAAGVAPALRVARLENETRSTPRIGRSLAMIQVGLSLVLLIVTGQLGRSAASMALLDTGFEQHRTLQFALYANTLGYSGPSELAFYERVRSKLGAIPGVVTATFARDHITAINRTICRPSTDGGPVDVGLSGIGADYWAATGIPLLRGRDFVPNDGAVTILSAEAARVFFPGVDPIGRTLRVTDGGTLRVVGIARDVRAFGERPEEVGAPTCRVFIPLEHAAKVDMGQAMFIVRTAGAPAALLAPVRDAVDAVDPRAALVRLETMTDATKGITAGQSALATSAGVLAALALALACIGLYGVVSYMVARRMTEMGIRLALGASPARLFRVVLGDAMRPVLSGLALGLAGAALALKLVGHSVIGLDAPQPLAIIAATLTLVVAALIAATLPARRAARADPVQALRRD
ncbi:MAG TPA: ABC transporter permease [Gemmatimonadaceae bacterium]|nr:ABC transporter permease [Gemmatimonadaceae bacterium]